jgi:hypothetical protein
LLSRFDTSAVDVEVDDVGTVLDMDDADTYQRMSDVAPQERLPDRGECRALQERHGMDRQLRAHCARVAAIADALADTLNREGCCLNRGLLRAAATLHDLARGSRDHAKASAQLLTQAGYPRLAPLVAAHMDLPDPPPALPGERELLYLADKLVSKDRLVSLDERLSLMMRRLEGDERGRAAAGHRLAVAGEIAETVETLTRRSLFELVA